MVRNAYIFSMADTQKEPFLGYITVMQAAQSLLSIREIHPPDFMLHPRSTPEDFHWFTLDGALDHLQHGVTAAFNFNYSNHWGAAPSEKDNVDHQQFRAELASGMRFVHGIQPTADSHDHSRDH